MARRLPRAASVVSRFATTWALLMVRVFLTHFERDYAAFNRLYLDYFPPTRLPARTTVGVTALARGGIVEIDMIAYRPPRH